MIKPSDKYYKWLLAIIYVLHLFVRLNVCMYMQVIKNYQEMFMKWSEYSRNGFYQK